MTWMPTTCDVRMAFERHMIRESEPDPILSDAFDRWLAAHASAAFDRWLAAHDIEVATKAVKGAAARPIESMARIRVEPDAGDDAPPCLDLTCPCGGWAHQCDAYNTQAGPRQSLPGVRCPSCDRFWRLDLEGVGIEAEYETFD